MSGIDKSKIDQLLAVGRIDQETAEQMLRVLNGDVAEGGRATKPSRRRAVAVAIASGPGANASAASRGGVVKAVAGPGETVHRDADTP